MGLVDYDHLKSPWPGLDCLKTGNADQSSSKYVWDCCLSLCTINNFWKWGAFFGSLMLQFLLLQEATIKAKEVILHHLLCNLRAQCLTAWLLGHWGTAEYSRSNVMQAGFLLAKFASFQATVKFTSACLHFHNQAFDLVLFHVYSWGHVVWQCRSQKGLGVSCNPKNWLTCVTLGKSHNLRCEPSQKIACAMQVRYCFWV